MAPDYLVFLGASAALTLSPGPDNLFIVAQGLAHGRGAALATAWGMVSGVAVHTLAVAGGLAALIHASPAAFQALRFAGIAYLLWLAWKSARAAWRKTRSTNAEGGTAGPRRFGSCFLRGALMNVLNPKVAIFFLAFLPPFVPAGDPRPALTVLLLGLVFMGQALILFSLLALVAAAIGRWWQRHPQADRLSNAATACVLVALAALLAWPN